MLKEFCGHVFKRWIMHCDFNRHFHHIQSICAHPAGSICLFKLHFTGEVKISVEYTNVIQSKEATFKDVVAINVFTVDPPCKIDDKLLKYFFQELNIANSFLFLLYFIYLHGCPRMNR